MNLEQFLPDYAQRLAGVLQRTDWSPVVQLAQRVESAWHRGDQVFLCGNGGSAANATHLANDLLYGVARRTGAGVRVHALSANAAVMTCLANDVGYEHIFSEQLAVHARQGDLLIALSGSGRSPNIVRVLMQARAMGVHSVAVVGYDGGVARDLADTCVHIAVDDMQLAEDMQLVIGHMLMQWLRGRGPGEPAA